MTTLLGRRTEVERVMAHFGVTEQVANEMMEKGITAPLRGTGGGTVETGRITEDEIRRIATRTADEVMARVRGTIPELAMHTAEHEVRRSGLVLDEARARATPCKCFEFEGETYCWSPGVLGLISSKKNPEQLSEFCVLGREPAGEGAKERFTQIGGAIREAHEEWQRKGEGLPEWWEAVGKRLAEKGIEL